MSCYLLDHLQNHRNMLTYTHTFLLNNHNLFKSIVSTQNNVSEKNNPTVLRIASNYYFIIQVLAIQLYFDRHHELKN